MFSILAQNRRWGWQKRQPRQFFLEILSPSSPIMGHNWKHDLVRSCFILHSELSHKHPAHRSKSAHFGKNISVTFSMTTKGTCWVLAKTGAERSVDDFVSLRTAMKYYDNLAKRKRRLKKKVKAPLVVIFLLIFYSCSGTVWTLLKKSRV